MLLLLILNNVFDLNVFLALNASGQITINEPNDETISGNYSSENFQMEISEEQEQIEEEIHTPSVSTTQGKNYQNV